MPISGPDLAIIATRSIADYERNEPTDLVQYNRVLWDKLKSMRKGLRPGGEKKVNIRTGYGTNFAYNKGEGVRTFNKRGNNEQATWGWTTVTDGFYLAWDDLFSAGLEVKPASASMGKLVPTKNEQVILIDTIKENYEQLKRGFDERMNIEIHRDGTHATDAIAGLNALVSRTPAVGTVGGLDASTRTFWRNYFAGAVATVNLLQTMETAWQYCIRNNGGKSPNFIKMGTTAINVYRTLITLTQNTDAGQAKRIDAGVGTGIKTGLFYKGVEIMWDPVHSVLDGIETPVAADLWEKRIYMLTLEDMCLEDGGVDIYSPASPHNLRTTYVALDYRFRLETKKRNSHALIIVA
jgi:hypothetical protein